MERRREGEMDEGWKDGCREGWMKDGRMDKEWRPGRKDRWLRVHHPI